jgi:hypothetical protein
MLAFTLRRRKQQSRPAGRPETAERRLNFGLDARPQVRKFQFQDVFRNADHEAELVRPQPRAGFRQFFARWAQPPPLPTVEQRMDASFGTASGARLTLLM